MRLKEWINKNLDKLTLLILSISAVMIFIIPLFTVGYIEVYGQISKEGNIYYIHSESINCESVENDFILSGNTDLIESYINNKILVSGQLFNDTIRITGINDDYDPITECAQKHERDILLELPSSLRYTINANQASKIEYDIINTQDKKLFYECKINIDCNLERNYVTGYIDTNESVLATFTVTCPAGEFSAVINTIFVDELGGRHTKEDSITILSN